MKKKLILATLLAIPLGTLLADYYRSNNYANTTNRPGYVEEESTSCNRCRKPACNTCHVRHACSTCGKGQMRETPMYEEPMMVKEYMDVPYEEQVVEEYMDVPSEEMMSEVTPGMYEQQMIEEYIETTGSMAMTPEQRAAHANLMSDVRSTSGKKPSQVAKQKRTTTKKSTAGKKSTAKKQRATKKKTTNGNKVAKSKTNKQTNKKARVTA